jgi:hypothetical protein
MYRIFCKYVIIIVDKLLLMEVSLMKRICKLLGNVLLGMAAIIVTVGPASISSMAAEDMPQSMKSKR